MKEYALAFSPQRLDGARCVVENELEVGVGIGTVVDQPELDVIEADLPCSHAAQADHSVVVRSGHRIDAAEQDAVVVRVRGQVVGSAEPRVIEFCRRRPTVLVVGAAASSLDRQANQIGGTVSRPAVHDPAPPGGNRRRSPTGAEEATRDGRSRVGVPAGSHGCFQRVLEVASIGIVRGSDGPPSGLKCMHHPTVLGEVLRVPGFGLIEQRAPVFGDLLIGDGEEVASPLEVAGDNGMADGVGPQLARLSSARVVMRE